jgi:AhpD family alkylhydroperoxidase
MTRLTWYEVAPEATKAISALYNHVSKGTALAEELIHLVFLRASQINACAHCIDKHGRDLRKTMSADKVALVEVWDEVPALFTDQERAALAWTEEVTNISETHASDGAYEAALAMFGPKNLVDLTVAIATINAVNRLGSPFRLPVAARA